LQEKAPVVRSVIKNHSTHCEIMEEVVKFTLTKDKPTE